MYANPIESVVICFIESKNKTGDQKLNPFDFQRRWTVTKDELQGDDYLSPREKYLEQELLQMKKQFALFQSCLSSEGADEDLANPNKSSKGKGRGKRSTPQPTTSSDNQSLFVRLRNSFSGPSNTRASSTASINTEPSTSSDPPPPYSSLEAGKKTIFIKQVELLLNGAPLDQIDSRETEDDCIFTFWKMYQNGGYGNSLFSCNIRLYNIINY